MGPLGPKLQLWSLRLAPRLLSTDPLNQLSTEFDLTSGDTGAARYGCDEVQLIVLPPIFHLPKLRHGDEELFRDCVRADWHNFDQQDIVVRWYHRVWEFLNRCSIEFEEGKCVGGVRQFVINGICHADKGNGSLPSATAKAQRRHAPHRATLPCVRPQDIGWASDQTHDSQMRPLASLNPMSQQQ